MTVRYVVCARVATGDIDLTAQFSGIDIMGEVNGSVRRIDGNH